ncbi:D-alanyl-D-alanine carboxypeptidase / D-alanyl-D-alanine-endopeptidase (penicillin-binding protein 4) [Actinopolymorpha cephalotaxi]|uniref:D-alanyl-D-alanine carboxypeptidase / D-alanyl-D-alanine-endopeptidase (Penicillin-binding protein 4) n=1 Tax=Actinopolymorpha cephalotaxi TaxID=504797 RepID=A0A1I2ND94_9ACTN|nr:D-alanyl-D-alanine carboxypeptidase/D-alanyl-D-alanine-endopeptidase [Actinopolymorpha cephalotaxi]NYH85581.1 D-alanyl-D-alanine carboxypeptidase/D-alanyl-D-alanine-endopeptidase (penicillin-binding protein 4) [Actinopolymorpha cephalotaxi]SFG01712.1 D-alanyl-D-alanine carboxypeptidase / D-alanyl-D-alanine-endopeptidase (penicillin-binding protein 4) [Actinopolymorpha cephalotaxi]
MPDRRDDRRSHGDEPEGPGREGAGRDPSPDPSPDWWADERRRRQTERAQDAEGDRPRDTDPTPAAPLHPATGDSGTGRSGTGTGDAGSGHAGTGRSLIDSGVPGPRRRLTAAGVAILVVCALVVAGVTVVATGAVRLGGSGAGVATSPGSGRTTSASSPTATPTSTRAPARAVLPPPGGTLPTAAGLAAALKRELGVPELAKQPTSVAIRDVTSGRLLYGKDPSAGFIPASTTKLLTSTAALGLLGPDHRFTTKVVRGAKPGQIVLVGGGDPSLATAAARSRIADPAHSFRDAPTVDSLAARTAKALRAAGTTSVSVRVDDSLFSEQVNPKWEAQYVPTGVVARISALWVDENKLSWPSRLPRAKDPAVVAGDAFVAALGKNGITVTGEPSHGRAPAKAATVASVQSPPLADLVGHVLLVSDNDGAEILARQVAVASGKPATFAGAAAAVKAELTRLGVAGADKISLYDGSGLSRHNRISADVLTKVLVVASRSQNPKLRPVLAGLPIAGFTGSLARRFGGSDGVGLVRAKTGTLSGVSSLAGLATTKDGATLAFAVMSDKATKYDPHTAIDALVAELADCGCR